MKTITENEFFEKFLKISQDLTYAEVRMLYLLITEPYIIDLPQQILANRLQTHRRTINIGLKKLREFNYAMDSLPIAEKGMRKYSFKENVITKHKRATANKVIISSFEDYYSIKKKSFIINEDYYSFILSSVRLPLDYVNNKDLITDTIRKNYPEVRFYFDLKRSSYYDDNTYYIIRLVNSEIIRVRKNGLYRLDIVDIFQKIYDGFLIEREQAQYIIKSHFPKIRITEKSLSLRYPN